MPRSSLVDRTPPDLHRGARRVALTLLLVTVALVGWIVLQPGPPAAGSQGSLREYLEHGHGLPSWVTFEFVERAANVVLFLPIGGLLALSLRRGVLWAVPVCAALSGLIEIAQWLFLPARFPAWSDVVMNSLGALLGFLLVSPILLRRRARTRAAARGRRRAGDRPLPTASVDPVLSSV